MKVLLVHNHYQIAGGEDVVLANEYKLLVNNGNDVEIFQVNNDSINTLMSKILAFLGVVFSIGQYGLFKKHLRTYEPDIVHVHNYFPVLSPAVFYACKSAKVPVVHTLHNYRAICPTATLMIDGQLEERSISKSSWWAIKKKVYKESFFATFALVLMIEVHKKIHTWHTKIDRFITLTEISKTIYIRAGWPAGKIFTKPNFIEDPFKADALRKVKINKNYALYVGRLSEEKGISVLLDAWTKVNFDLKIIGDGPLRSIVAGSAREEVQYLGLKEKPDVLNLIQDAEFVVLPSVCHETFGMVIIEAFACQTPVLGSDLGGMREIIKDGVTGLHFEAGNAQDLAEKAQWLIDNPECAREMGQNARNEYLAKYTPEKNYEILMDIYQQAIDEAKKS